TASDGAAGDDFGFSVAIDGDTVVVGAYQDDNGSAYVFNKPGGGWNDMTETAKLTAEGSRSLNFGISVAISGDTVVVGANWAGSVPRFGQGSAYIFVKPGGGWATTSSYDAKLTASDAVDNEEEHFGRSVAISGDNVVAGADHDDIGSNTRQGSAYVFVKPGGGWNDMTETAKLTTAVDAHRDLMFGSSVAINGDTIVAGAPGYQASRGSAYIYNKPGGGWATTDTYTARLTAAGGTGPDEFGESVAIDGDKIVAGAYQDDSWPNTRGSAFLFVKPGGGWATTSTYESKLIASDRAIGDRFGYSVAVSGDTVVVGAYQDDVDSNNDQGSAYAFEYREIDLGAAKTNAIGGAGSVGTAFDWTVTVTNTGVGDAVFNDGQTIFKDDLPPGPTYGTPTVQNVTAITNSVNINCAILGTTLTCMVDGPNVTIGANTGSFDVVFSVTPGAGGDIDNPVAGGECKVDPDLLQLEIDESNNDCADTVAVNAPDLQVIKTNDTSGVAATNIPFNWTATIFNNDAADATFTDGQTIFSDDLPSAGATYGVPVTQNFTDITNSTNIDCQIAGTTLDCTANGADVTIGANTGSFDVVFSVTPNAAGDITNPAAGGTCKVDPDGLVLEIDETNNTCADTVTVTASDSQRAQKRCSLDSNGATCITGPFKVVVAANTVMNNQACQIVIEESSAGSFELDGRVFDVKVICNGVEMHNFEPAIKVCIKPTNAQLQAAGWSYHNLVMHHNHAGNGWQVLADTFSDDAYLCARLDQLSLFTLTVPGAPATGFPLGVMTALDVQPAPKAYFDLTSVIANPASARDDSFVLEIPRLDLELPIVGVPLTIKGWDVTWLGERAGYLESTAFPTWAGNTALTAHVWNADNTPGPFIDLHTLRHGDQIIIHAWGQEYVYEVRATQEVRTDDFSFLPHAEHDVLTLITCKGFDPSSGQYDWRLVVRAVLVDIK
ncbi:MAG: sortase, partial [Chloroflexi bacterium]|nr:sortase [Chloroflexota bacterium]